MKIEEAIELLEDLDGAVEDNQGRDYDEAFRMAIKALQFTKHFDLLKEYQSLQEVVRCKDCKYADFKSPYPVCNFIEMNITDNDYCSWGERSEP